MTKVADSEEKSNKAKSNSNLLHAQNQRMRRTFSFINLNRKRAIQYCTLNKAKRNRRLSLNQPKSKSIASTSLNNDSVSHENLMSTLNLSTVTNKKMPFSSLGSITNQLRQYAEEFSLAETNKSELKTSKFKRFKLKFHMNLTNNAKAKNTINYDQSLKDFIQKQQNRNISYQVNFGCITDDLRANYIVGLYSPVRKSRPPTSSRVGWSAG